MLLTDAMAAQRHNIALSLDAAPRAFRPGIMTAATVAFGGTFVPDTTGRNGGSHMAEVSLLGISHMGHTTDECIANWIKAVLRSASAMVTA